MDTRDGGTRVSPTPKVRSPRSGLVEAAAVLPGLGLSNGHNTPAIDYCSEMILPFGEERSAETNKNQQVAFLASTAAVLAVGCPTTRR